MRVIVSGSVVPAVAGTSESWKLHRLLAFAVEGRHAIVFEDSKHLLSWLETVDQSSRDAYLTAMGLASRMLAALPANVATIRIDTGNYCWNDPLSILSLDDALQTLAEPLGVLVENSENDWYFLRGMMLKSERQRTQKLLDKGWLLPVHGGGSTLIDKFKERIAIPSKGLRTFVMFDSDRVHPDEHHPTWTTTRPGKQPASCFAFEWEKAISQIMPARYWMLRRRFIESYMPKGELLIAGASQESVAALHSLPTEARWFFNMKAGLTKDAGRHDSERAKGLFDELTDAHRQALAQGLVNKLADHYEKAITSEFDWDTEARQEARTAIPKLTRLY
jgi:hypothetical protein